MKQTLEGILDDETWPMEIRTFIFEKWIKNQFRFTHDAIPNTKIPQHFLNPLFHILQFVKHTLKKERFHFGTIQLQLLAEFLERNFLKRLNYKECLRSNDPKPKIVAQILWFIMAEQPLTVLDRQLSYWAKRVYNSVFFGSHVPVTLEFEQLQRQIHSPFTVELDQDWHDSEIQQQIASDQQEVMRQKTAGKD